MNNFTYEQQGNKQYIVYRPEDGEIIDTLSLGMLTNNSIPGIAPAIYTRIDNIRYIKYRIPSKINIENVFSQVVSRRNITNLFMKIVNTLTSAEDYMLDSSMILLDKKYIFTDKSLNEIAMVCIPSENRKQLKTNLQSFFQDIMFSIKFDDVEDCSYIPKIMNYLKTDTAEFSLEEFKYLLKSLDEINGSNETVFIGKEPVKNPIRAVTPQSIKRPNENIEKNLKVPPTYNPPAPKDTPPKAPISTAKIPSLEDKQKVKIPSKEDAEEKISLLYLLQHYNKENAEKYKSQKGAKKQTKKPSRTVTKPPNAGFNIPGSEDKITSIDAQKQELPKVLNEVPADFGETVILRPNHTTDYTSIRPHLIRKKTRETIYINKDVFVIGRFNGNNVSSIDYGVSDNMTIGRQHATILTRGNTCFIVDNNSVNHTYIDGVLIDSDIEYRLYHGTRIKLSDEEFEFNLY